MNTDQEFKQNKCSFESQTIKSWPLSQSYFLASTFNLYRGPERILWNEFTGPLMLEWVHNTPKYLLPCTIFIQHPLERRREALSGGWMPKIIELRGWVFPPVFSNSKKEGLCAPVCDFLVDVDRNGTIRARDPPKSFDTDACIWKQVASPGLCLHSFFALSSNNISLTLSLWSRHCMSGRS